MVSLVPLSCLDCSLSVVVGVAVVGGEVGRALSAATLFLQKVNKVKAAVLPC